MIEETAVVTKKMHAEVQLEIERRTACGICGQTRGCGNATWGKMLGHQQGVLTAKNTVDAKVGDRVVVGIEEKVFLNATFLLYVLPLTAMFIVAGLAELFVDQEILVMLGAILGLFLGFLGVKKYVNRTLSDNSVQLKQYARQPYATILRFSSEQSESK
jgi:sigma-E factor negative regulatory protein RseC